MLDIFDKLKKKLADFSSLSLLFFCSYFSIQCDPASTMVS
jgi:hypothetical protein